MSEFNMLSTNYIYQTLKSNQVGFLVFTILLPLFTSCLQKIYNNKIEIAIFIYKKYKTLKELFSKKSEEMINFFHYVEDQGIFHFAGYSKGETIKVKPDQVIIDREISVKINGNDVPSLSGFDFHKSSKYDSSTTFLFIYPHIFAHEDDFELEVKCLITNNSASKKYEKGSHIDLKKDIDDIVEKDLGF